MPNYFTRKERETANSRRPISEIKDYRGNVYKTGLGVSSAYKNASNNGFDGYISTRNMTTNDYNRSSSFYHKSVGVGELKDKKFFNRLGK